jgi:predicted NBD/HSP70 family sugar kinase
MRANHSPELMRHPNRASILATIQGRGPISRVELAQLLDLNPATVTRITRTLLDEGLICEIGEGASEGAGRKPVLLGFNNRAQLLIAVHAQPGWMTGVVADLAGTFLTRRTILLSSRLSARALLPLFEDLLGTDPSYRSRLTTACVGWTHPDKIDDSLCQTLSDTLGISVLAAQASELAALGEAEGGAAQGQHHFALVSLGSASRACIYLDRRTRVGGLGLAPTGELLTERLSDAGLIAQVQYVLESGEHSALQHMTERAHLSAAMIFEAARQHDPLAQRVVDSAAEDIAWVAVWLSDALVLDTIVLGGTWHHAADILIPLAAAKMNALSDNPPALVPVGLGDDAAVFGAVQFMLERVTWIA